MQRLQPISPEKAEGRAKQLLDGVKAKLGMVPNIMRTLASSPAALGAYLAFAEALRGGSLGPKLGEQIALAVGQANGCDYCVAAHSAVGGMLGLSEEEILDNRRATSADSRTEAALKFARTVVAERGWVGDPDVARLREAGYGDGEIAEIVAHVALNLFTNYFNHIAETEVDFPAVAPLAGDPA